MTQKYLFKHNFCMPCLGHAIFAASIRQHEKLSCKIVFTCAYIIRKIQNLPYKIGTLTGQKSWHSWILCVSCVDLVSAANNGGADFPCLLVLKQPFTRSHVSVEFPIPFRSHFPRFLRLWPRGAEKLRYCHYITPSAGFFFWPWIRR